MVWAFIFWKRARVAFPCWILIVRAETWRKQRRALVRKKAEASHVWTIEAAFATVPPAQSHHDLIFFFRSGEQKIVNGGAPRGRVRATVTMSGTSKQALHTGKRSLKLGQTLS